LVGSEKTHNLRPPHNFIFILLQISTYTSKFCFNARATSILEDKMIYQKINFFSQKVVLQKKTMER
jgi:hypothetical protein